MQGWLNVTRALLGANYIGFSLFEVRLLVAVVVAVNLRMFLGSLIHKEQCYIWFLGDI